MEKINKGDLIEIVAEKTHINKKDAENAINATFDLIEKALIEDQEVNISNFGTFTPMTRKERDGTDPNSHNRIIIKSKKTVSFKPAKALKGKLNK